VPSELGIRVVAVGSEAGVIGVVGAGVEPGGRTMYVGLDANGLVSPTTAVILYASIK